MSPRLFLRVCSTEARRRMSYRVDFWINAFVSLAAQLGLVWFLWTAMFAESGADRIGGLTLDGVFVYYVAVLLVGKLVRGIEFENQVSQDIYEGGMNRYLVLPASYFWFKYAQHVGSLLPAVLQLLLFGIVFAFVLDVPPDVQISPASIAMCCASLVLASLLHFALAFPLQAVAFWADNVWSLLVALRFATNLLGGLLFPLALFPAWVQDANAWLPFPCLFAVPAEAFLGRLEVVAWLRAMAVGGAWCIALGIVDRLVWRRGNLQYGGVGI